MKRGYFLLSRLMFESAIWSDDPHILKLFIYLVGTARHTKKPKAYPTFKIKRGELVTSLRDISDNNEYFNKTIRKWSAGKVSRMLHKLEEQGYINILADTYGTHIKVCNYETYQDTSNYLVDSSGTEADSSGTVVETNNNVNNVKNVKNEKIYVCDNPPTDLEVKLYMLGYVNEKELGLTEEDVRMIHLNFINHYGEEGTNWTYMAGGTKKTKLQRWHSKANKFLLDAKGKKNAKYRKRKLL